MSTRSAVIEGNAAGVAKAKCSRPIQVVIVGSTIRIIRCAVIGISDASTGKYLGIIGRARRSEIAIVRFIKDEKRAAVALAIVTTSATGSRIVFKNNILQGQFTTGYKNSATGTHTSAAVGGTFAATEARIAVHTTVIPIYTGITTILQPAATTAIATIGTTVIEKIIVCTCTAAAAAKTTNSE